MAGAPHCPDLLRTSLAIEALAGVSEIDPVKGISLGVKWLLGMQDPDGGWGPRRGADSDVLMTCFATSALLAVAEAEAAQCDEPIRRALAFLACAQRSNGSFDPEHSDSGIRTAYAALCLQRGERCELSVHRRKLEEAVGWLEANPVPALKEIELTIEIDPNRAHPVADYAFVFMTEAVVARLLSESPERGKGRSPLAREALSTLFQNKEPDGAFFGRRVFSWSTARAIYALGAARHNFDQFPKAPRGPSPEQVGRDILFFAGASLAAVVVLSIVGVFGLPQAVVVMFLVLALLLGYGRLSEAGFGAALRSLVPWLGRGPR